MPPGSALFGLLSAERRISPAGLIFVLAFLSIAACSSSASAPPAAGEAVLRIGLPLRQAAGPSTAAGLDFVATLWTDEALVETGRDGRHRPKIAERWAVAPDRLSLTLYLRRDVRFQDGTPLTSDIVRSSLERSRTDPQALLQYPLLQDIAAIDIVDSHSLVLRLARPSAVLLDDLEVQIRHRQPDGRMVGTGPFQLAPGAGQSSTTMRANPYYYGGRPTIDAIELKPYPTVRAAWAEMMRGEIDLLFQVPNDARDFVERESSVQVFPILRNYVFSLVFNMRKPQFQNASVRAGLGFAVDRSAVVERALRGRGEPARGYLWPEHWTFADDLPSYGYDPARATQLLKSALTSAAPAARGRLNGADRRIGGPGEQLLRFTCLIPANASPNEEIAVLLQKQFFEVGVDMEIEPVALGTLLQRLSSGDFDTILLDLSAGPGLARVHTFWHSSSPYNQFGYRGADAALDALHAADGEAGLRAAARRVQETMYADPPALFLCWPEIARALSRRFSAPPGERNVLGVLPQLRLSTPTADADPEDP